jgi:H+/gluconate symporter-like permease
MNLLIVLAALAFLMLAAYRGHSVILFAPIAALGAVLLTDPSLVPPMFSSVFMEKMVVFVKNYFPVFMLGAVFGKVIEKLGKALHQRSLAPYIFESAEEARAHLRQLESQETG